MMKTKNTLEYVSMIYGILVTLFMLLAIVPKLIEEFIKEGFGFLIKILVFFGNWESPIIIE